MSVRELTSKFVLAFFSTSRVLDTAKKKSTQMMNPHQHIRCYINKQSKAVTTTHFPSVLHLEEDRSSPVFLCAICRGQLFTWFIASLNAPSFNLSFIELYCDWLSCFEAMRPHDPIHFHLHTALLHVVKLHKGRVLSLTHDLSPLPHTQTRGRHSHWLTMKCSMLSLVRLVLLSL